MKFRSSLILCILLFTIIASSCSPAAPTATPTVPASPTVLPSAPVTVISAPKVNDAAVAFLAAWKVEDYKSMYDMLATASRDAIALDTFKDRYTQVAVSATLTTLEYKVLSSITNVNSAQVNYQVTMHTRLAGDITREMTMLLALEKGIWKVQWDDGMILPELKGGNTLQMDIKTPTRGIIYDQTGNAIAANSDIVSLGVIKGQTNPDQEGRLIKVMSDLTGKPGAWIKAAVDNDRVYNGTYIPLGEALRDEVHNDLDTLGSLAGVAWQQYQGRFYFGQGIAPHVTGYISLIQSDEVNQYKREGFSANGMVGRSGIELWGEKYLLGQRGADLYVVDPQGREVTSLKKVDSQPSQSIYLTIDSKLQAEAQRAIAGFNGAIVVLERNTGRVLAMVSSPGFDPNAWQCGENFVNQMHCSSLLNIVNDGRDRFYNRATGNGRPLGSVFKIITMAAALESGVFPLDETLDCQYEYNIDGTVLYDWTKEKGYQPSGILTLPEGLMRSCNPWFYHIGEKLYSEGRPTDISNMARAFGLGSLTGIEGVQEFAGNIPDPTDKLDGARIAIGQSTVLVNPLQVARFVAAVGNGGTLYKPQVIEKIVDLDNKPTYSFKAEEQGKLPVKPENLKIIQDAMRSVVANKRGTAVQVFTGLNIPVYGKTGTAQSDGEYPHAWFAGYTDAQRSDKPDIAFAVLAEYAGEGSEIAAPIARRILEVYFLGQPQRVYPWESGINVTQTPTGMPTDAPAPVQAAPSSEATAAPPPEEGQPDINIRTATPSP